MSLSAFERWYSDQCDEWEHAYGVSLETLDNPGWRVSIDLAGTKKATAKLDRVLIERSEEDWIQYWITKPNLTLHAAL